MAVLLGLASSASASAGAGHWADEALERAEARSDLWRVPADLARSDVREARSNLRGALDSRKTARAAVVLAERADLDETSAASLEQAELVVVEARQALAEARRNADVLRKRDRLAHDSVAVARVRVELIGTRAANDTRSYERLMRRAGRRLSRAEQAEARSLLAWRDAYAVLDTRSAAVRDVDPLETSCTQVDFGFGSAVLDGDSRAQLAACARRIAGESSTVFQVLGTVDEVGPRAGDPDLAWERALAVRSYLVQSGAHPHQLEPFLHDEATGASVAVRVLDDPSRLAESQRTTLLDDPRVASSPIL